jgi:hypothetical protein
MQVELGFTVSFGFSFYFPAYDSAGIFGEVVRQSRLVYT